MSPRPPPLSEAVRATRAPLPPEVLVDALQDRICPTSGKLLGSTPIRFPVCLDCGPAEERAPTRRENTEERLRRLGFDDASPEQRECNLSENLDAFLDRRGTNRAAAEAQKAEH